MKRSVGIKGIEMPEKTCNDKNCPFHGTLSVRGRIFKGIVKSFRMQKTATIEWTRVVYVRKYERYMKKRTRVKAHVPECLDVKEGDEVIIGECRPLSKTKHFVVLKVVKRCK